MNANERNAGEAVFPETIPYAELPPPEPDSPLSREWNFYRGEVGRLLKDGHEGQFVLIKGEQIIGIWGTREEAKTVALQKYLMQPCLIQQVRSREPIVRMSARFLTELEPPGILNRGGALCTMPEPPSRHSVCN